MRAKDARDFKKSNSPNATVSAQSFGESSRTTRSHPTKTTPIAMSNPLWFKDAVIYQLHVKTFQDSDGDGVGDFRGLLQRLDYFTEIGVTALWLLPFYPSPLRDDGYDIADYFSVNAKYLTQLKASKYVCTLSPLFREDVLQRFAAFLSRIGLPELIGPAIAPEGTAAAG